jgi:hypothetical protein
MTRNSPSETTSGPGASASYRDGVLRLVLPRTARERTRKTRSALRRAATATTPRHNVSAAEAHRNRFHPFTFGVAVIREIDC